MKTTIDNLKEWRQALFEAHMQYGSQYSHDRLYYVLRQLNELIGDGEDIDHVSSRNEK
jgi:hypothetical protein